MQYTVGGLLEANEVELPVSVVARSKAWVCGLSLAENAGSNPDGGVEVCL